MKNNKISEDELLTIDVNEKVPLGKAIPLSFQHLFAMFGSSVLVPIMVGIDPTTVLFFNGIGTLLYAFLTKKKIPAYLGSSFAFLSPVFLLQSQGYDFRTIQGGFVVTGLLFAAVAIIIGYTGTGWINKLFPPAAMGAIVTIIGLELASSAADMAGFPVGGSNTTELNPTWVIGGISLLLFGSIATSGLRTFIEESVDFSKSRNLILTSVIFIIGLSGISINLGSVSLKGMGLATVVGLILNLAFLIFDKLGIMNEPAD